jgi:ATP-dependent Clp protease ATP-binding subunit ClpA
VSVDLVELEIAALRVWGPAQTETRALTVSTVVSPTQQRFVEVFAPRWGLRFWIEAGEDVPERAAERLVQHSRELTDDECLRMRRSGPESLHIVTIEPEMKGLDTLRYRQLFVDQRESFASETAVSDESPEQHAIADLYDQDAGYPSQGTKPKVEQRKQPGATLKKLGDPWHERAKRHEFAPVFERDDLVSELLRRLQAPKPDAVVLVGPSGAGKTAIVQEVARRLTLHENGAFGRFVYFIDAARLIGGEGVFGDWQKQLFDLLREAQQSASLLVLGSLALLLDAGRSAKRDDNVAQLLGPALLAREVVAIGEATVEEWTEIEQRNPQFARGFSVFRVEDPTDLQLRSIVARVCEAFAQKHQVAIESLVPERVIALTRRFFSFGATLGNAVSFLKRVLAAQLQHNVRTISESAVISQFSTESGIPEVLLRDDVVLDPRAVQQALKARVVGQPAAVDRVTEVVSVLKAALQDTRKPVSVLFFAGPTGVGKTELARTLAQYIFGSESRLVRLDMGEYNTYDALQRLVGDWNAPGTLCAAVRRQPFSVVLLDEIEKAHPLVFDALLGVLGEGRLSDSSGRFTDFRNCVIVMTSNLGAETIREPMGFSAINQDSVASEVSDRRSRIQRQHYVAAASEFFRPELFNRIDDFVVFEPLSPEAVQTVVIRELKKLSLREGLTRFGVSLIPTSAAIAWLADVGTDRRYGARPLKRAIERHVTVPLASFLLNQGVFATEPVQRNLRVSLDVVEQRLQFRVLSVSADEQSHQARLAEVLTLAQSLRVQTQQWTRTPRVVALREESRTLEMSAKLPGFWQDANAARDAVRRGSAAKSLLELVDRAELQATVSEDLAFEAYYDRSTEAQELLLSEFAELRERLKAVRRALFFAGFTPLVQHEASVLYLSASRAAWKWLEWLRDVYRAQAKRLGLTVTEYCPMLSRPLVAPESNRKEAQRAQVVWSQSVTTPTEGAPAVLAMVFRGDDGRLFSAEAGTHRIHGDGAHLSVRCAFATAPLGAALLAPSELEQRFSSEEIRKVFRDRRMVRDLRTHAESSWSEQVGALPSLDALFEAWVRLSVLG